ncbi:X-Pro dipeptidyl-peptidase [Mycolicibacterium murale]|uniref:X-Pro dipeptidyl-peptidase n=1 Tax=Mycolicibacterium murale TaxID=182220 RepID=A0A7I9WG75_9MYCO|nr:CocE/NonD family hydrolase [Mycolicibacterium murale]MCV7181967.1 CocE/NonD family hydrolase [Mycolicibacterium murale]GFG56732.1 X-Pro dipeptidyl-peptidase [Mycolicibacterium murale]
MAAELDGKSAPRQEQMSFTYIPPGPLPENAQHHMVRMRDGVRLATDVYLPNADGPVPVILTRLPYDKCGRIIPISIFADALLENGYGFAVQDVRGKFRSEGETVPWRNEAYDGYDTIEWIVNQPWSNGRVGMTGLSYTGYAQWAALSTNHPALRAIAPRNTNTRLGNSEMAPGEPEWSFPYQYIMDFYASNDLHDRSADYDWAHRPLIESFEDAVERLGIRPPALDMHLSPIRDGVRFPAGHPLDAKPIPVLLSLGLFDPYCSGYGLHDYRTIMANPAWSPFVHLRLSPSDHDDFLHDAAQKQAAAGVHLAADVGSIDIPDANPEEIRAWFDGEIQFFDRYLRCDAAVTAPAPVRYHLANSSEPVDTTSWPPPESTSKILHLATGDGEAAPQLSESGTDAVRTLTWQHNPEAPVPSSTKFWSMLVHEYPDFSPILSGTSVLAFRGAPRDEPLALAGPVTLYARVHTTGQEMDLFVMLLDLEPDGTARFISRGQRRLHASEPADIAVSVGTAGYVLQPQHSLVLVLRSSDYPDFLPLSGTSQRWWFATSVQATTQSIVVGGPEGARLDLTVL